MLTKQPRYLILVFIVLLLWMSLSYAAAPQPAPQNQKQPAISLPEDVGTTIAQKAASVKTEIANRASSLFERTPIGWNWNTIEYLYKWAVGLPLKLPEFIKQIMEQSRVLGVAGSCIVFIFLAAVFYSLLGRKRILAQIEKKVQPLRPENPADHLSIFPFSPQSFGLRLDTADFARRLLPDQCHDPLSGRLVSANREINDSVGYRFSGHQPLA